MIYPRDRLELIEGAWYPRRYPPVSHVQIAATLLQSCLELLNAKDSSEGWWIVREPEVVLGDSRVIPSLAGWQQERVPEPPSGPWWRVAPDWVCEISSPETRGLVHEAKRDFYRRQGVPFLWEIDASSRCIEVWQLLPSQLAYQLVAKVGPDVEDVHLAPFRQLTLRLSSLWK